jgi:hypothetical protein
MRNHARLTSIAILSAGLGGCASVGAPSFVLFGAFFPAWMFVALIGILIAFLTRFALLATGLAAHLPLQLPLCLAVGLTAAVILWTIGFAT